MLTQSPLKELFSRYQGNPIITAKDLPYPANTVFNPAATLFEGDTLLLLRVEDRRGQEGCGRKRLQRAWRHGDRHLGHGTADSSDWPRKPAYAIGPCRQWPSSRQPKRPARVPSFAGYGWFGGCGSSGTMLSPRSVPSRFSRCVVALRWLQAYQDGAAAPVVLASTHERVLEYIPLEALRAHAVDVPDSPADLV